MTKKKRDPFEIKFSPPTSLIIPAEAFPVEDSSETEWLGVPLTRNRNWLVSRTFRTESDRDCPPLVVRRVDRWLYEILQIRTVCKSDRISCGRFGSGPIAVWTGGRSLRSCKPGGMTIKSPGERCRSRKCELHYPLRNVPCSRLRKPW